MNMIEKPKDRQKVFALLADGTIAEHYWSNNDAENRMFLQGNIFETEKDARSERDRRILMAMSKKEPKTIGLRIMSDSVMTDFLVVDEKYYISFEDIMQLIMDEKEKCQKA